MLRPLVKYGAAGLHAPAAPVAAFDAPLGTLIDDMVETMYAEPGIGLAAPQIGVPLRVAVIDLSVGKKGGELVTLVNPEIVERCPDTEKRLLRFVGKGAAKNGSTLFITCSLDKELPGQQACE